MKLTVLGGAAAGGNPGQGCSGYLVEHGATRIVLDLGPGTLPELRRHADFRTLSGVVVSHLHLDHTLDLGALRFALAYNPVKPPGRIPLWLPPGGLAWLGRFAAAFGEPGKEADFFPSVFDPSEYDPDAGLTVGAVRVAFRPTVHYVPCWAMRVSAGDGGRDLGYTADTGPSADLAPFFSGVGVLIAEGNAADPGPEPWDERGHLTFAEAGDLARAAGAETLVLTHLWEERGIGAARDAAAAAFGGRVEVARPGMSLGG